MAPIPVARCTLAPCCCSPGATSFTHSDTEWARAALERNPDLTIVATDADAKTFTVQVKGSNELRVLRIDEIVGAVPSSGEVAKVDEPAAAPSLLKQRLLRRSRVSLRPQRPMSPQLLR